MGFLAGAIEEARICAEALDGKALAALRPGSPGAPKPLALWTFEDGKVTDAMGAFPEGVLKGAARIENGRLLLDGKSAYAEISRPRPPRKPGMFYKARSRETGNMWDTWLYYHDGTYYLYYLANSGESWDNVSMATSPDGVHFTEVGRVLKRHPNSHWMGTGSTWKSPNFERDGKYFINFSQAFPGQPQTICFGESTDLIHWEWLDIKKYEFVQDARWYEPKGRWDCIYTMARPGGGLYGYWTATPKEETGGRFGFGQSLDGAKWEALEPPKVEGVGGGEAGAVEKIGAKYYMMFGNHGKMSTLVAERPEGPFILAKKNPNLLSGHTYFSRFFPTPDGVLVNHHSIARNRQVYFGLLKSTILDAEGTLRLGWWKGNEKLKEGARRIQVPDPKAKPGKAIALFPESFNATDGLILEGRFAMPAPGAEPVGLYIAQDEESGTAIRVHPDGHCDLGEVAADGSGFKAVKTVDREMDFGSAPAFRLLLRESLLEFYLNDILIECYSLPDEADGRIGAMGAISKVTAWQCQ